MKILSLAIRGATKSFTSEKTKNLILDDLNLTIDEGSIYTLVGSSGCGKTTLISSVLGMVRLDEGEIFMFGKKIDQNVRYQFSSQIGYMPQEIALIGEMTVKETIYYFAYLHQMKLEVLRQRYSMIRNLLDLPADDLRLENCSGGQQRRVSFASAIIHDPKLLILDEPTVGLDVILRDQIWKFLLSITTNEKKSVIITTHYIEEAMNANRLGIMRNGKIIIEENPRKIIRRYESESLEEAVYKVFKDVKPLAEQPTELIQNVHDSDGNNIIDEVHESNEKEGTSFGWKMTRAILKKHISIYKRQPGGIIFNFILPLMITFLVHISIGRNPTDIKLGIINYEAQNCSNMSMFSEDMCPQINLSCLFLNEINSDILPKINYESREQAHEDSKKLKIFGYFAVGTNFSSNFVGDIDIFAQQESSELSQVYNNSAIEIYIDHTDLVMAMFVNREVYSAYSRFLDKYADMCGISKNTFSSPLNMDDTMNGKLGDEQTSSMFIGTAIQQAYFATCGLMIMIILSDRKEGLWNRTLLAGVKVKYIITSQLIMVFIINIIQNLEYALLGHFLDMITTDKIFDFFIVLTIFSSSGAILGLFVAFIFEDYIFANSAVMFFSMMTTNLAGVVWPFESFEKYLKIFATFLSFALPTRSVNNVIFKDMSIVKPEVYKGLFVLSSWSIISLTIGAILLNKRVFSRNT